MHSEVLANSTTPAEEELKIIIREFFGKPDDKFVLMEQRFNELEKKIQIAI